ncbi:MAG: hypothetical protein KAX68_05080, partial [Giesbergeria sp.]|nr:hypothetical protein [Giesbergeria sp.]
MKSSRSATQHVAQRINGVRLARWQWRAQRLGCGGGRVYVDTVGHVLQWWKDGISHHGHSRIKARLHSPQAGPLVQVVEVGFCLVALLAKVRFCEVATYGLCRLGGLGDTRIAVGKRIIVRRQDQAQLGI